MLVGRQDVAEPRGGAADPAGADPARRTARNGACRRRAASPKVRMPFALGCMPVPAFADDAAAVQDVELELRERRVPRTGCARAARPCAGRSSGRARRLVVAERRAEDRAHADVVAVRASPAAVNCRPVGSAVVRSDTSRRGRDGRARARASGREAKSVRQPPTLSRSRAGSPRNANVVPDGTLPEAAAPACDAGAVGGAVQHRHELREVLGEHVRRRHREATPRRAGPRMSVER